LFAHTKTRNTEKQKTMTDIVRIIVPVKSILALRKAISSMKDVGSLITLWARDTNTLEISVLDHFQSSAMYTNIPIKTTFQGSAWVNISSEELSKLASKLKAYPNPLILNLVSKQHLLVFDAVTKTQILKQFTSTGETPTPIYPIQSVDYHNITFVSLDLLGILVDLSVGSAIMSIRLTSDGQLVFSNKHEYGTTVIEKQLSGFLTEEHVQELCKMRCIIKFIKQVVNHLVNCSKQQCVLGVPKNKEQPLVLKFLLASDIYQHFLMLPFHSPLHHEIVPGSTQNPIQVDLEFNDISETSKKKH